MLLIILKFILSILGFLNPHLIENKETSFYTNKTNILFILTDDQGWGDFGFNGNSIIQTPTLDSLSNAGVLFDRFYVSSVCAPTRAALLTGKYHPSTGVTGVSGGFEKMNASEITLAEKLMENGYVTACFGKWHNGKNYPQNPEGQGFDEFLGFTAGGISEYFNPILTHNGKKIQPKGYITDILTDAAISFIKRNKNKPFFCYLPYNAPHSPYQVPDKYFNRYDKLGLDPQVSAVYGMCENIDYNIGRVLNCLKQNDLMKNTIIVFTSDNGPTGKERYNGHMKGKKAGVDEGSVRVPLILAWDDYLDASTFTPITAHIDIFPTLLSLCEISFDTGEIEGLNLVPYLKNEKKEYPDRTLFLHQSKNQKVPGSVRTSRYRLTIHPEDTMLYDMLVDPYQKNDIASENPMVVDELTGEYNKWIGNQLKSEHGQRPIPVGFDKADRLIFSADESNFNGKIRYFKEFGYTSDWLTGFSNPNDSIWWQISPLGSKEYTAIVYYTCTEEGIGTEIKLLAGNQFVENKITKEFDPELMETSNRAADPGRTSEWKPFAALKLGKLRVDNTAKNLVLKIQKIPVQAKLQILSVQLQK